MSKRTSESGQMRREEYEAQSERGGDEDLAKEFKRADNATLSKRKIVSVSRRFKKKGQTTQNGTSAGGVSPVPAPAINGPTNPFAGFSGLTAPAPTPAPAAPPAMGNKTNPFAGFTGLTANMSTPTDKPKAKLWFPAPTDSAKPTDSDKNRKDVFFSQRSSAAKPIIPPMSNGTSDKIAPLPFALPGSQKSTGTAAFDADMLKLNTSFWGFAKKQIVENPHSVWVEAAKGYLDYVKKLELRHGIQNEDIDGGEHSQDQANGAGSLKTTELNQTPKPVSVSQQGFWASKPDPVDSAGKADTPKVTNGFGLPGSSKPAAGFSFGAENPMATAKAPAPASTSAPAFSGFKLGSLGGGAAAAPAPAPGGFSFGSKPLAFGTTPAPPAGSSEAAQEEVGDAMPAEEATVVERNAEEESTESIEHEVRAKLYQFAKTKEGGEWKDMGVGVLRLMKHKENNKSRILMRNSAGKISLNSTIFESMKFDATSDKGTIGFITAVKNSESEKPEPVKFLLKVKKDNFSSLYADLNRLQKEAS